MSITKITDTAWNIIQQTLPWIKTSWILQRRINNLDTKIHLIYYLAELITDASQIKMTFHLFPKSGVLGKKNSHFVSGKVWTFINSIILAACDVTNYINI